MFDRLIYERNGGPRGQRPTLAVLTEAALIKTDTCPSHSEWTAEMGLVDPHPMVFLDL